MKKELLIITATILLCCSAMLAQSTCDDLFVDFKKGTINGLEPTVEMDEVKAKLPCFTGETEENTRGMNCGGGVFYLKHYFNIYTKDDFIRIRKNFKGKFSKPVYNESRETVLKKLGKPDAESEYKDAWLGTTTLILQYQKKWGVLSLMINDGLVSSIEMHHGKKIADVDYCF